jgi:hypothetical protein
LAPAEWYERYGRRVENYHLPKTEAARLEYAATIGADGQHLLTEIDAAKDQPWLTQLPAVRTLRAVWEAHYVIEGGNLRWRSKAQMPAPADQICSPYDPDARFSTKRTMSWVGYKVQLTETCDPDMPHVITNVETTPASTPDDNTVAVVHESLKQRALLPSEHLVDKGYTDSHVLVDSQQQHGVTIVGPVADDPSWQARSNDGLSKSQFQVDWTDKSSPAQQESRVSPGCQTPGLRMAWNSRSGLLERTARHAHSDLAAPGRELSRGSLGCRHASTTRHCKPPVSGKQLRSLRRVTLSVPGSKGRMRKRSVAADYAGVAISGWRKPICSTWSRLPP